MRLWMVGPNVYRKVHNMLSVEHNAGFDGHPKMGYESPDSPEYLFLWKGNDDPIYVLDKLRGYREIDAIDIRDLEFGGDAFSVLQAFKRICDTYLKSDTNIIPISGEKNRGNS